MISMGSSSISGSAATAGPAAAAFGSRVNCFTSESHLGISTIFSGDAFAAALTSAGAAAGTSGQSSGVTMPS